MYINMFLFYFRSFEKENGIGGGGGGGTNWIQPAMEDFEPIDWSGSLWLLLIRISVTFIDMDYSDFYWSFSCDFHWSKFLKHCSKMTFYIALHLNLTERNQSGLIKCKVLKLAIKILTGHISRILVWICMFVRVYTHIFALGIFPRLGRLSIIVDKAFFYTTLLSNKPLQLIWYQFAS